MIIVLLIFFVVPYLVGSIPFGLILTRLAGKGDIRKIGSGNIGATNVLRTGSKGLAALTLLLDGGKGFVIVFFITNLINPDNSAPGWIYDAVKVCSALGVVLGHIFPIWLKFRGGKGVATALGVFLALSLNVGLIACVTWLIGAFAFRYSSLSAILAMLAAIAAQLYFEVYGGRDLLNPTFPDQGLGILTIVIALIVILRHHANIRRLLAGTEPKIGKTNAAA